MKPNRIVGSLSCLLLLVGSIACGSPSRAVTLGADSPEALVARLRSAAEAGDLREIAACLEPDARRDMAQGLYMAAVMTVAFSGLGESLGEAFAAGLGEATGGALAEAEATEATQELEQMTAQFAEIAARYQLPTMDDEEGAGGPEEMDARFADVDHVALIGDLSDFFASLGEQDESPSPSPMPDGEITDLVIDGDQATARFGGESLEMVRIDGRWYARDDSDAASGGDMPFGDDTAFRSPSDPPDDVTLLSIGETHEGVLDHAVPGEGNWHVVTATTAGTVTAITQGTGENDGDLILEAHFDDDFSMAQERSDQDLGEDSSHESLSVTVAAGQALYLHVRQFGGGNEDEVTSYRLSVTQAD